MGGTSITLGCDFIDFQVSAKHRSVQSIKSVQGTTKPAVGIIAFWLIDSVSCRRRYGFSQYLSSFPLDNKCQFETSLLFLLWIKLEFKLVKYIAAADHIIKRSFGTDD